MLRLLSQELWTLLASASEQPTGIPQKILDDKAEELRIKFEAQKAITVSPQLATCLHVCIVYRSSRYVIAGVQEGIYIGDHVSADTYNTDGNGVCQHKLTHPACVSIRYNCLMHLAVTVRMLIRLIAAMCTL